MINRLRAALLNALESDGKVLISETTKAVLTTLQCDMCTLWSVSFNSRPETAFLGNVDSASLIIRCLKGNEKYANHNDEDFVHTLRNSFIEHMIREVKKGKAYYECSIDDEGFTKHFSYGTLKAMGLSYFICIPIWEKEREEIVAVAKLAFKNKPSFVSEIEAITDVISNAYTSTLSRFHLYQRQDLWAQLIDSYSRDRSTLRDLFHPIITRIIKSFFDYEGASVYIWDSFDNRFNLLDTTGLMPSDGDAFYEHGEGLTGLAASEKKAKIYDNLLWLEDIRFPRYMHKHREKTYHVGKTLLAVPILRPSNSDDVVGIIRFTNKINKQSVKEGTPVIDYFNKDDVELIENASHYLALNIENYLAEEERKAFISKMSHEFKTPANSIRVTAERALRKVQTGDTRFMRTQHEHYMKSIVDCSTLQLMQVKTNLFLTKANKKNSQRATIGHYSLYEIVKESINIVRPIAIEEGLRFENIRINNDFPRVVLQVDKNAFIMVFYNLLTNAIKYHGEVFDVVFDAKETPDGLSIFVSDQGIGIAREDTDRIFLLGVRSKEAKKISAAGYGIGLHVVKLILNSFRGLISVSSNQNPTTFEIKLPRELLLKNSFV